MTELILEKESLVEQLNKLESRIGKTPLLDLSLLSPRSEVKIYAKAEWKQLSGSVKARAAFNIIKTAVLNGSLTPGKSLLDASSGNTAIAYAAIAKEIGLKTTLVIPRNASRERKDILKSLGADLIYSSEFEGTDGAQLVARELFEAQPWNFFYADQYNNPANWKAHFETTGPEIIEQTKGAITHFAASLGTTGTFVGTGRFFKENYPKVKLVQLQPNNPLHGLEGWKHLETAKVPGIFDENLSDENLEIDSDEAVLLIKEIHEKINLRLSPSAAAAILGAIRIGETIDRGVIVTTLADNGDKYGEVYKNLEL